MGAGALRQTLELAGEAQDGLTWLEGGCQAAAELGRPRQHLLDGARAGEQRHLARQAVERDRVQAQRGAHAAHGLARTQTDVDAQSQRAERRQAASLAAGRG